MRKITRLAVLVAPLTLAACGTTADLRRAQEEACAARVAEQTGVSAADVRAVWQGQGPAGTSNVDVQSANVTYTCQIDDRLSISNVIGGEGA